MHFQHFYYILIIFYSFYFNNKCFAQQSTNEQLAQNFIKGAEYQKAADIYKDIYDNSNYTEGYSSYMFCLFKLKDFKEAENVAKQQLKITHNKSSIYIDLGYTMKLSGNTNKSKNYYTEALNNLESSQVYINAAGQRFYSYSEYDYALKAYLKGREIINNQSLFFQNIIRIYQIQQKNEAAITECINQVIFDDQSLDEVKRNLSLLKLNPNDFIFFEKTIISKQDKQNPNLALIDLMIWQYLQNKNYKAALDYAIQIQQSFIDDGRSVLNVGKNAQQNKNYDIAYEAFNYLITNLNSGIVYKDARIAITETLNQKLETDNYTQDDLIIIEKNYNNLLSDFGKSKETYFIIEKLAILQAYYLKKYTEAISLLTEATKMPKMTTSLIAECKLQLGDIYILNNEPWEATLLFGQVDKTMKDSQIGQEARFKLALLSFWNGETDWAKAQFDVIKANTSQFYSNDALEMSLIISENKTDSSNNALKLYAKAHLENFKHNFNLANSILDSISTNYPDDKIEDDVLMLKANILLSQHNYNEADKLFLIIVEKYPYDIYADNALFKLAETKTLQNKNAEAMKYYEQLISNYPSSILVTDARKNYRLLRGDNIITE